MWQLYAFGAAVFAAMVAILGKIGLKDIDSTFATTIRAIIMALFLFLVSLLLGKFKGFSLSTLGSRAWLFVALSGIAGALSWLCYFYALKFSPETATTAVAAIDKLSIVFVAVLAALFLSEGITLYKFLGVALIALGAFLTVLK